ncbi:HECT-like ubiquitin-conjugating enzyme-binding-domain-containing protein [Amylostereum chailletii]|nr:HECT-like ubiquitin-conjugating enzyme-binding-domain-containing protein [Amylostereum chailletii]
MATLTRTRPAPLSHSSTLLAASVPSPFSSEDRARLIADSAVPATAPASILQHPQSLALPQLREPPQLEQQNAQDVIPSIAYVQQSVLMTLNDLLSTPSVWQSIVPDRRHSMPGSSRVLDAETVQPKAALQTLLANLRSRPGSSQMEQIADGSDERELLGELRRRIDILSPSLDDQDAELASTLVTLLAQLHRLSVIGFVPSTSPSPHPDHAAFDGDDVFTMLTRQLSELQLQRVTQTDSAASLPPVLAVEKALLWAKVDENLDTVLKLCKRRAEQIPSTPTDNLPPEYDPADYDVDAPPQYEHTSDFKGVAPTSPSTLSVSDEKMRMDLDAVTMAIDRLYRVAPQLHTQRVELNTSKLEELERAGRAEAGSSEYRENKKKERELEMMVTMLGKASERRYADQTVTLDGGMSAQMERARQRNLQQREEFVDKLLVHSDAGRMHSQDASFVPVKPKDPEAMLTLPEFIRESVPRAIQPARNPNDIISLFEAVGELPDAPADPPPPPVLHRKSSKTLRSRSMSAPSLQWLLHSGSRSPDSRAPKTARPARSSRPGSSGGQKSNELRVSYVAEHHENLHHVMAFISVTGMTAGVNLEAEVANPTSTSGRHTKPQLVLRSGPIISPPLALPAQVSPGPQTIQVQTSHYEVKLPSTETSTSAIESIPLLDASELLASHPTTFICASCSLPIVQSSRITRYDDLPSEHWAELVDAWMCHSDQTLSAQVSRHGRGFWPREGQALVGGSYILFDASAVTKANLWLQPKPDHEEEWHSVRCKCGTFSGRCQDYVAEGGQTATVYRLVKYAIRPVSPTAERVLFLPQSTPCRIPLSAFIVEDMIELAQAHATYRFVVLDEEEERPRVLLWLFKPRIRISYAALKHYSIPKQGTVQASKLLYKILGPATSDVDFNTLLNKYPGFPQAEHLMYPKDVCMRLAALLKESNACYPESLRTMTGLDVGWLIRG